MKDGKIQITTIDERWYARQAVNKITGLPEYDYIPSVTWIAGYYPKGIAFYKWLANTGWDEAEAIKSAAGDKGSRVHQATEIIDCGGTINIGAQFIDRKTDMLADLTIEEVDCILSFCRWLDETKPVLLASEMTVFGDGHAGTLDRIYKINNQVHIVDIKTSQTIWEEHILQVSAYSHSDLDYKGIGLTEAEWQARKLAILQLGYRKNKAGFKYTEIPDKYDMFKTAMSIWKNENSGSKPKQKDYPLVLASEFRKNAIMEPAHATGE
jgi:hypothetical protein